jgi:hypothetical protein
MKAQKTDVSIQKMTIRIYYGWKSSGHLLEFSHISALSTRAVAVRTGMRLLTHLYAGPGRSGFTQAGNSDLIQVGRFETCSYAYAGCCLSLAAFPVVAFPLPGAACCRPYLASGLRPLPFRLPPSSPDVLE